MQSSFIDFSQLFNAIVRENYRKITYKRGKRVYSIRYYGYFLVIIKNISLRNLKFANYLNI